MASGAFCIWKLLALTGTTKQIEVMVLFMVSDRSSAGTVIEVLFHQLLQWVSDRSLEWQLTCMLNHQLNHQ